MPLQKFEIDFDMSRLDDAAFEAMAEHVCELGEECGGFGQVGDRVYMSFYHESPSLSESLIHALTRLRELNVPIKRVIAPTD